MREEAGQPITPEEASFSHRAHLLWSPCPHHTYSDLSSSVGPPGLQAHFQGLLKGLQSEAKVV